MKNIITILVATLVGCGARQTDDVHYEPYPTTESVSTTLPCGPHPEVLVALATEDCAAAAPLLPTISTLSPADAATARGLYARFCERNDREAETAFREAIRHGDTCRGLLNLATVSEGISTRSVVEACETACPFRRGNAVYNDGASDLEAGRLADASSKFQLAYQLYAGYPTNQMTALAARVDADLEAKLDPVSVRQDVLPLVTHIWGLIPHRGEAALMAVQTFATLHDTGDPADEPVFRSCCALAAQKADEIGDGETAAAMRKAATGADPAACPL